MIRYDKLSEPELISLLKQNNSKAFIEIWNRYHTLLFSFAYRRINDKESSKDLVCEAFADIWEKRVILNIPGELGPFLIKVIKNRVLDHYKHQKVLQKYAEHFQGYLNNVQDNADHLVRHNDLAALIEKEIAALPRKMRVVFELSRKNDMSRKEIAEYLGVPEATVKTNISRALKILKGKLPIMVYLTYCSHLPNQANLKQPSIKGSNKITKYSIYQEQARV